MSTKKRIDKLFQEHFNEHEVLPPDIVWENIEAHLKEKQKKRVIPFWWKLSGVAALFTVGLGLYNLQFDEIKSTKTDEIIVNKNKSNKDNSKKSTIKVSDAVVNNESINSSENENVSNNSEKVANNKEIKSSENENKNNGAEKVVNNGNSSFENSNENNLYPKSNNTKKTVLNQNFNSKISTDPKNNIAKNNTNLKAKSSVKKSNSDKETSLEDSTISFEKSTNLVVDNAKKQTFTDAKLAENTSAENKKTRVNNSIIEKTLEEINKKDSTKVANVEPNALEELLKEKEVTKKEPKLNRWQLTPNVAPIYFSSTSNGSPLDSQLSENVKEYNTNYSYGLGINYALTKKINLRTGVNVFSVGYKTDGISFEQTSKSSRMQNIDPTAQGAFIQIKPVGVTATTVYSRASNNQSLVGEVFSNKFEGSLDQRFGYFEMPIELSYKVIDKKIGVEFIGGMSTLLLNQNEVLLNSATMNMKIGEANNLNRIHFSGNLGLGLKYSFWKKLDARIEPVFKYQIRTFTNDVGDFKPYVFGVYSGVSYSF